MEGPGQTTNTEAPPSWLRRIVTILLVASIALAGAGLVLPMADFVVDTMVGPAQFKLDSKFTQGAVEYTGAAPEYGVNVSDELRFIEGTGEYQERIGFLKGTAKERMNYIVPYTTDYLGKRARLDVTVGTKTIPWWVAGVAVPCYVEVELVESLNVSSLTVDRVYFELWREEGDETLKKVVWEKKVSDSLTQVGKRLRYDADIEVAEDLGKFELFAMVEVTMKDTDGVQAVHVFKSYSSEPKTITLWTIPLGQGVKIGMVVVAMPVTIIGIILAAIAIPLVHFERRGRMRTVVGAAVGILLGALFFYLGTNELATLVGYPDDLSFRAGFAVAMVAFVPAMVGAGLMVWASVRWPPEEEEPIEGDEDRPVSIDDEPYVEDEE
jgi:hypothetical protein